MERDMMKRNVLLIAMMVVAATLIVACEPEVVREEVIVTQEVEVEPANRWEVHLESLPTRQGQTNTR